MRDPDTLNFAILRAHEELERAQAEREERWAHMVSLPMRTEARQTAFDRLVEQDKRVQFARARAERLRAELHGRPHLKLVRQ